MAIVPGKTARKPCPSHSLMVAHRRPWGGAGPRLRAIIRLRQANPLLALEDGVEEAVHFELGDRVLGMIEGLDLLGHAEQIRLVDGDRRLGFDVGLGLGLGRPSPGCAVRPPVVV
ncbi:MAG: hypothetical protein Q9217_001844 [Psora testacea]